MSTTARAVAIDGNTDANAAAEAAVTADVGVGADVGVEVDAQVDSRLLGYTRVFATWTFQAFVVMSVVTLVLIWTGAVSFSVGVSLMVSLCVLFVIAMVGHSAARYFLGHGFADAVTGALNGVVESGARWLGGMFTSVWGWITDEAARNVEWACTLVVRIMVGAVVLVVLCAVLYVMLYAKNMRSGSETPAPRGAPDGAGVVGYQVDAPNHELNELIEL